MTHRVDNSVVLGFHPAKAGTTRFRPMAGPVGCVFYSILVYTWYLFLAPNGQGIPVFGRYPFIKPVWVCMGLDGSMCSECLSVVTCDFEPPKHVPRTSARAHTCVVVFGRALCVPRSREHEERPAAGRDKNIDVQKTSIWYIVIYKGCFAAAG